MTNIKSFRHFLSVRPAINNPNDDKKLGMNDKGKKKQKSLTLYGSKHAYIEIANFPNLQTLSNEREKFSRNFLTRKVNDEITVTWSLHYPSQQSHRLLIEIFHQDQYHYAYG